MKKRATIRKKDRFVYVRPSPAGNLRTFMASIEKIEGVPVANTQVLGKDIVIGVPPGYVVSEVQAAVFNGLGALGYDIHVGHRPRPRPTPHPVR